MLLEVYLPEAEVGFEVIAGREKEKSPKTFAFSAQFCLISVGKLEEA